MERMEHDWGGIPDEEDGPCLHCGVRRERVPMRQRHVSYRIEHRLPDGRWAALSGAMGPRSYCEGYMDALDSLYGGPDMQYRMVSLDGLTTKDVVREQQPGGKR